MNEQIGYRDVNLQPTRSINNILEASPTGRNLLVGSDVEILLDSDPTGTVGSWPNGFRAVWVDGADLKIGRYTRETGWKSTTLS